MNYEIINEIEGQQIDIVVIENDRPYLTSSLPLLIAINRGTPIVTRKWLKDSALAHKFLPLENYVLKNKDFEKKYKFSFLDLYNINRGGRCNYLKGKSFYVYENVNDRKDIIELIKSAQGLILDSIPNVSRGNIYLVMKKLEDNGEKNFHIISSDSITYSVLGQKLIVR